MYDSTDAQAFIRSHTRFVVLGHKEPDGDCVSSQLAVADLLTRLGHQASVYSVGPFDRPEIASLAQRFASQIPTESLEGAAVVIVDCSTPDRTGALGKTVEGLPTLVIDHHSSGEAFGTARFVEPTAPSSSMLALQLYDDLGLTPDSEMARLLLFGLCTDTGFFRHLAQSASETFRAVARLADLGATTAEVFMMVYGRRELAARKLLGESLVHCESHWSDRFLLTWQTLDDRVRLGVTQRGEDDLYRLLQTVRGNVVVALIKEE
ncbi:MAG TPA: DHH family phosphoesterase, partial [Spirochaetia bacterium]|nr:DHH family phosphoesterase [Spirochaetia bacterium]